MNPRAGVVASVFLIAAVACGDGKSPNPEACVNHDAGWCPQGTWCKVVRGSSGCVPFEDGGSDAAIAAKDGFGTVVVASDATVDSGMMAVDSGAMDQAPLPDSGNQDYDGAQDVAMRDTGLVASPDGPRPPSPDMGSTCANSCTLHAQECSGAGVHECVASGGCTAWGPVNPCPSPQVCVASGTAASCACPAGSCSPGAMGCGPGGGPRSCSSVGACGAWSAEMTCPSPQVCSVSGGSASCRCPAGSCSPGAMGCGPGGGLRSCSANGACGVWTAETTCPSPQVCSVSGSAASCGCPAASCSPGTMGCGPGGGARSCSANGACGVWTAETTCPSPQICAPNSSGCSCPAASCSQGAKRCGTAGGVQECVIMGACSVWGPESPCQAPPANASVVCAQGVCQPSCNPGTVTCSTTPLLCDNAQWPFESALDGFTTTMEAGFSGATAVLSAGQAHAGSRALTIGSVFAGAGSTFQPFIGAERGICGVGFDPRGRKVTAFVFLDGPDINQTAPDNGLSSIPSCAIAFLGGGRAFASDMPSGVRTAYTRAAARSWLVVQGFFPNVDNITPWLTNALSIQVFCNPIGTEAVGWIGTMYVDDVSLQ
jgi:hypothetical protein